MRHLHLHFVRGRCETRKWQCCSFGHVWGICCRQEREKLSPTKPRWTPRSCRAPVLCDCQWAFAPHNNTLYSQPISPPPMLKSSPQGILTPLITIPWFLSPGLFPSRLVGASRPRLPTQMGVQACDGFHMSHRTCGLVLFLFFLCVFSFHLSSLSLFCSLKWPKQGGRGECRWGWRGSNVMPINTFQREAEIKSQLGVYISQNNYCGVKDCKVKMTTFYCQKANGR